MSAGEDDVYELPSGLYVPANAVMPSAFINISTDNTIDRIFFIFSSLEYSRTRGISFVADAWRFGAEFQTSIERIAFFIFNTDRGKADRCSTLISKIPTVSLSYCWYYYYTIK